jgi:hypothetical protein
MHWGLPYWREVSIVVTWRLWNAKHLMDRLLLIVASGSDSSICMQMYKILMIATINKEQDKEVIQNDFWVLGVIEIN